MGGTDLTIVFNSLEKSQISKSTPLRHCNGQRGRTLPRKIQPKVEN